MQISYNWLKEYVPLDLSADKLAEKLTFSGIEVGSVERFGPVLPEVIVALVTKVEEHPHKRNLSLVQVNSGKDDYSIVCGAKNMKSGDKVVLAKVGAELPGGRLIKESEIHGTPSRGMLCSAHEIGLDLREEDEILILDETAQVGDRVDQILQFDDYILDLELTPNRADCLSMVGVALEVSALTGAEVTVPVPAFEEISEETKNLIKVVVEDKDLCPRYTARIIKGVKVKRSPLWLQLKLLKAGIRPINNIVDITNFVMWESGQPLHAFDLDKLNTDVMNIRRAMDKETLVTLDGIERKLNPEVLVIADKNRPVALAGVMGGEDTEIDDNTSNILLEAASFHAANIRRTSRCYQLPSEAAQRFEKGIDPEAVVYSQNRAAALLADFAGGEITSGIVDQDFTAKEPVLINIRQERINHLLGIDIPAGKVKKIFCGLGFSCVEEIDNSMNVSVPLRRGDIKIEEDLIEEVARIYGYDKIPLVLPRSQMVENSKTVAEIILNQTKQLLSAAGLDETVNPSFINKTALYRLNLTEEDPLMQVIPVQNPLSEEQGVMRTTLLPGLLKVAQYNYKHREINQLFYELNTVYIAKSLPLADLPAEKIKLAIIATGLISDLNWAAKPLEVDYFLIKGIVEELLMRLGLEKVNFVAEARSFTHPTRSAVINVAGEELGVVAQLHPSVAVNWDIDQPVYICELDFDLLVSQAKIVPEFTALPRYPSSRRDIALVVPREITADAITNTIIKAGGNIVKQVKLFDLYEGEQVPEGKRSMAYSLLFRSDDATLNENEINQVQKSIEKSLNELGAVLRC